jgi:RNA polymerase sigma factor (sigma-70 family)
LTDRELIEGCRKKDAKSQRWLFDQFAGKMMTVCRRYARDQKEAEDILQEAFVRVFSSIDQFRFEGSLEGWIRRIFVHTALKAIQQKKVHFSPLDANHETAAAMEADILASLDAEELLRLIRQLPEGYRLVFNLYVIEGYDHNEIAVLLNITPSTSRTQLMKARRQLKDLIDQINKMPKNYA